MSYPPEFLALLARQVASLEAEGIEAATPVAPAVADHGPMIAAPPAVEPGEVARVNIAPLAAPGGQDMGNHLDAGIVAEVNGEGGPENADGAIPRGPDLAVPVVAEAPVPTLDPLMEVSARDANRPIGTLFLYDDILHVQKAGHFEPHPVNARHLDRLKSLIGLRDATNELFASEAFQAPDEEIDARRTKLNELYDAFVAKYGAINAVPVGQKGREILPNLLGFEEDPGFLRLVALERPLPDGSGFEKNDLFYGPVIRPIAVPTSVDSPQHALLLSLDHKGEIDLAFIGELLGLDSNEVPAAIEGLAFRDPETIRVVAGPENAPTQDNEAGGGGISTVRFTAAGKPGRYTFNYDGMDLTCLYVSEDGVTQKSSVWMNPDNQEHELSSLGVIISVETGSGWDWRLPSALGAYRADVSWTTKSFYLSGNVRSKLERAQEMVKVDARFASNVAALETVQPPDLAPEQIDAALGAPWIPAEYVEQFVGSLYDERFGSPVSVTRDGVSGKWTVTYQKEKRRVGRYAGSAVTNVRYGTDRVPLIPLPGVSRGVNLLEKVLNNSTVDVRDVREDGKEIRNDEDTADAMDRAHALREEFRRWVWSDQRRAVDLAARYNKLMNNSIDLAFSPEELSQRSFPGMNANFTPYPHQVGAVLRAEQAGNTLFDVFLGGGKTNLFGMVAMEFRRLKRARKPMMVVPNSRLVDTGAELQSLYPAAKIFVAGAARMSKREREETASRIRSGDFDMVIMAESSFSSLLVSPDGMLRAAQHRMRRMVSQRDATHVNSTRRQWEKAIAKLEREIGLLETAAANAPNDGTVYFDDLGVDMLLVDEAHHFKNISLQSANRTIAAGGKGSQKADGLVEKIRYLDLQRPGRNVFLASATPTPNSMHELYVYEYMLTPRALEEAGLVSLDAWLATFGEVKEGLEITASGKYRMRSRLGFRNAGDAIANYRRFAYVVKADEASLDIPVFKGGAPEIVVAKGGPATRALIEQQRARARGIEEGVPLVEGDSLFKVWAFAAKASIDPRLLDPSAEPSPDDKLETIAREIAGNWHATKDEKAVTLVFMDMSTFGKSGEWAFYPALIERLVDLGVDRDSIGVMQLAKSERAKTRLREAAREGRVRVLIGSTKTLGTGTNVQDRVNCMVHCDVTWRPDETQQRDGRGLRVGNRYKEVRVIYVLTEGSTEALRAQARVAKLAMSEQMRIGRDVRRMEGFESGEVMSAREVVAFCTGDVRFLELQKIRQERQGLIRAHERILRERVAAKEFISKYQYLRKMAVARKELLETAAGSVVLGGTVESVHDDEEPLALGLDVGGEEKPRGDENADVSLVGWDFSHLFNSIWLDDKHPRGEAPTTAALLFENRDHVKEDAEALRAIMKELKERDEPLANVRDPKNIRALLQIVQARSLATSKVLGNDGITARSRLLKVGGVGVRLIFDIPGPQWRVALYDEREGWGSGAPLVLGPWARSLNASPRSVMRYFLQKSLPEAVGIAKREITELDAKEPEWRKVAEGGQSEELLELQGRIRDLSFRIETMESALGMDAAGEVAAVAQALRTGIVAGEGEKEDEPGIAVAVDLDEEDVGAPDEPDVPRRRVA